LYTFYPLGFEGCVVRADADPYKLSETRHFLTLAALCNIAAGNIIYSIQVVQGRKFCTYVLSRTEKSVIKFTEYSAHS
jgi:hypothetical protein